MGGIVIGVDLLLLLITQTPARYSISVILIIDYERKKGPSPSRPRVSSGNTEVSYPSAIFTLVGICELTMTLIPYKRGISPRTKRSSTVNVRPLLSSFDP